METRLSLKYSGPSVDDGAMDVYQVAANMIAFSEFVVTATKITYGEKVEVNAEVTGIGQGSFWTSIVFSIANTSTQLFSMFSPGELITIISESFSLWKHLKGTPPAAVTHNDGQTVSVKNNNGQIIQVRTESFQLVMSEKATAATVQFVKKTLSENGVDSMEIGTDNQIIAQVNQSESSYFDTVTASEEVTNNVSRMTLVIEAPVFKDGNKWRFSDGQNSFYADILDHKFLASVDEGEQFGKGDLLKVDLRIKQEQTGAKITAERFVEIVHEHTKKPRPPLDIFTQK